ncbi:MAG: hypothetical protein IT167_02710 [Bryobacterales bacterium]|nr:hypothetical protein [Bryobacterales bacterium]
MLPSQTAALRECRPDFVELRRMAGIRPAMVPGCLALFEKPEQREELLRTAFLSAAAKEAGTARAMLPLVVDKPWLGRLSLYRAAEIARGAKPELAAKLLRAAALHNPSVALREASLLSEFPFGASLFEDVMLTVPGETLAIAASSTAGGARMLAALDASNNRTLHSIASLARDSGIDLPTRQRAAILLGTLPQAEALRCARDDRLYLEQLSQRPETASQFEAFALSYMLEVRNRPAPLAGLRRFTPRQVYLLLAFGRGEVDESLFETAYDALLKPNWQKLEAQPLPRLLAFLSDAVLYGRSPGLPPGVLSKAMHGVRSLEELVYAADVIDNVPSSDLPPIATALADSAGGPLYGLLAARLLSRLPRDEGLRKLAAGYQRFLEPPASLPLSRLFAGHRSLLQRYFFYNDDDGVLSFESFRSSYRNSPGWRFEDKHDYVRVTGTAENGRRTEIFANVPIDLSKAANLQRAAEASARQAAVSKLLSGQGREPEVVVHRGHAFHLDETIPYLTESAQLVILGSCRGAGNVTAILEAANHAQIIATRGTGSHTVNDPLLKALNDEILRANGNLDWRAFWRKEQARFHGEPLFANYIPPYENTAAIVLKAYYAYLTSP